jgi:hypothetical protein
MELVTTSAVARTIVLSVIVVFSCCEKANEDDRFRFLGEPTRFLLNCDWAVDPPNRLGPEDSNFRRASAPPKHFGCPPEKAKPCESIKLKIGSRARGHGTILGGARHRL